MVKTHAEISAPTAAEVHFVEFGRKRDDVLLSLCYFILLLTPRYSKAQQYLAQVCHNSGTNQGVARLKVF